MTETFGNSSALDCTSGFIFDKTPLDSFPGFVHWALVESIGHEWKGGVFVRVVTLDCVEVTCNELIQIPPL